MSPAPGQAERFRAAVGERLGLHFDDSKLDFLAEVLARRAAATRAGCDLYLDRLHDGTWREEARALAVELTVGETYFFRNPDHFRAFSEAIVPARAPGARLRVLSAGCASGEEAYTLAMLLRERPLLPEPAILGIDLNPAALDRARGARYSDWALRATPPEAQERHFRTEGREHVLADPLRRMVTFEERNLIEENPLFWQPGAFDVVFCRNVLMYFAPDVARRVVARITAALTPGGFLFLGHAETLRGLSESFHLRHTHETFYYQLREGGRAEDLLPPAWPAAGPGPLPEPGTSSIDAITRASERIARLTSGPASHSASSPAPAAPHARSFDLGLALELLRQEQFHAALELVCALPVEAQADTDAQLLRAVLLTNCGDLPEAERACQRVLALDELNAGAHYLMALCREHAGDGHGAREYDQAAVYLDPAFAMPRLHRGLLARRAGDREVARQELGQALVLLAREDAARVLLLGGGFSREGLLALCRAELRACGGSP